MNPLHSCIAAAWALLLLAATAVAQRPFIAHPPNPTIEPTYRAGKNSDELFQDYGLPESVLTGFVVHPGKHHDRPVIVGLAPIFLGPKGVVAGNLRGKTGDTPVRVEARPGYAVGGIGVKASGVVEGFQIFFMKILPAANGLDPADFYVSDWIGGLGGDAVRYLGNDGRLVLGFFGRTGEDFSALGLMQAAPASLDPLPAQTIAADDASNYEFAWQGAPARGIGFGPWVFATSDPTGEKARFGIGLSTSNGGAPPSGGIDHDGKSWLMYAAPDQAVTAVRTFAAPLRPGQQFMLQMDTGMIDGGGTVGFILQNAAGVDRLEFFYMGESPNYRLKCNGAELDTGIFWTGDGINLVITQYAGNHILFDMRTGDGHFATIPALLNGSDISQVKLYCRKAGKGSNDVAFWNGLAIRQPLLPRTAAGR